MKVLVTGNRGLIGSATSLLLQSEGYEVAGFDIADGHAVLDAKSVAAAAQGCTAIVHAAGGHGGSEDPGEKFITHGVTGNYNILAAAQGAGIKRVVLFSSVNAMGIFSGNGTPDYFPIDDDHPLRPTTPYGLSKRLIEEMARCFTLSTGIATICLRPPAVLGPARHAKFAALREADPANEWTPFWEYGAFADVRDIAGAVLCALRCPDPGHVSALACADDTTSPIPVRELARKLLPHVPWRGPDSPDALLVRCDRAKDILGWKPRYFWRDKGL
jgi:nucleoside-diphosphate-sugar epimerase